MPTSRASTRRAVPAAFLLFAAALLVVGPAEASRTTTDARSLVAPSSQELAPLELAEPIDAVPHLGFAEDLGLLDPEAGRGGFVVFAREPSRCELTYARNNPLKYVDPDGRAEVPTTVLLGRGASRSAESAIQASRGVLIANVLLRRDLGQRAPLTADGAGAWGVGNRVGVKLDLLRGDVSLVQSGGLGAGPSENRVVSFAEKMSINLGNGEVSQAEGAQVSLGVVSAEAYDNGDATVTLQAKKYIGIQAGVNGFSLANAATSLGETIMAVIGNALEAAGVTPGGNGPLIRKTCSDSPDGTCQ